MVRKLFVAVPIVALAIGSTACATKKFVRTSVGEVNDKVDSLGRSVEETQERTRQNEGRIADVDQRAQAAAAAASQQAGQGNTPAGWGAHRAHAARTPGHGRRPQGSSVRHATQSPRATRAAESGAHEKTSP